jgi:hypothetical protein
LFNSTKHHRIFDVCKDVKNDEVWRVCKIQ